MPAVQPTTARTCEEFYRAIRALNATLPGEKRYRVIGGDAPVDWDHITTKEDLRKWTVRRDTFPADVSTAKSWNAAAGRWWCTGPAHFPRKEVLTNYDMSNWQAQTMTSLLEAAGIRPFIILSDAGKETPALQPDIASWPRGA